MLQGMRAALSVHLSRVRLNLLQYDICARVHYIFIEEVRATALSIHLSGVRLDLLQRVEVQFWCRIVSNTRY